MKRSGSRHSVSDPVRIAGLLLAVLASPAAAAPGLNGASGPWVANEQARVRLIAAQAADGGADLAAGIDLGLEFELAPGWHVYWKNSGDAGYPPRLDLSRSPALAGSELLFPAPRRYDLPGGLVSFGYEGQVIYPLSARLASPPGARMPSVSARLDYLVCRAECIPHAAELALDIESVRLGTDPEARAIAARLTAAREALPRDPGAVAGAPRISVRVEPGPASSLVFVFAASGGSQRSARPDLFFEVHPFFALESPHLSLSDDGFLFRVPFRPVDETKPMPATTAFAWTLTGLERNDNGVPEALALAGTAHVEIPHLRTSATPPGDASRPGFAIPLLVAGLLLVLFALHRFRNRRS